MTTPTRTIPNAQYYKDRGLVRYTVTINEAVKAKIEEIAKANVVSQGDVIEVVLGLAGTLDLATLLKERKDSKVDGRKTRGGVDKELAAKLKKIDPAALAAFLASQGA